jgi:hypothetical protein
VVEARHGGCSIESSLHQTHVVVAPVVVTVFSLVVPLSVTVLVVALVSALVVSAPEVVADSRGIVPDRTRRQVYRHVGLHVRHKRYLNAHGWWWWMSGDGWVVVDGGGWWWMVVVVVVDEWSLVVELISVMVVGGV